MVEVGDGDARRVTDAGFVADVEGMRFANRPLFYLILLLTAAAVTLTAYVVWKLPEAEELSRAKKKAVPPSLPATRP